MRSRRTELNWMGRSPLAKGPTHTQRCAQGSVARTLSGAADSRPCELTRVGKDLWLCRAALEWSPAPSALLAAPLWWRSRVASGALQASRAAQNYALLSGGEGHGQSPRVPVVPLGDTFLTCYSQSWLSGKSPHSPRSPQGLAAVGSCHIHPCRLAQACTIIDFAATTADPALLKDAFLRLGQRSSPSLVGRSHHPSPAPVSGSGNKTCQAQGPGIRTADGTCACPPEG